MLHRLFTHLGIYVRPTSITALAAGSDIHAAGCHCSLQWSRPHHNKSLKRNAAGLQINTPPCRADLTINAVAVKLPALWPDNPNKCFLYCEGKFRLHSISKQQTMFDNCIQAMTAEQSDVVMELMERGPSPTCYDNLKTAYIRVLHGPGLGPRAGPARSPWARPGRALMIFCGPGRVRA